MQAVEMQRTRYRGVDGVSSNSELGPGLIERYCREMPAALDEVRATMGRTSLSARGVHTLRKVARTCADLEGSSMVQRSHIHKAERFLRVPQLDV